MNKDFLVLLLQKDIEELNLLTEGFEKMTEIPSPLLVLARQKADSILISLNGLEELVTPAAETRSTHSAVTPIHADEEYHAQKESIFQDKNNFDAPLDSDAEYKINAVDLTPEPEVMMTAAAPDDRTDDETAEKESYEDKEHQLDKALIITGEIHEDAGYISELENQDKVIVEEIPIEMLGMPETEHEAAQKVTFTATEKTPLTINGVNSKPTALLGEVIGRQEDSLGEVLANQKIDDIRQAINIGDRFRFQRELFNGNGEVMNKTIAYLNQLQKFEEAQSFLKAKFNWQADNLHAEDFLMILRKRYA